MVLNISKLLTEKFVNMQNSLESREILDGKKTFEARQAQFFCPYDKFLNRTSTKYF